jgi:tRNA/tmRNA/rRNA uracil-C5-methylase (TrmA/RlmC/RlmD family)
MLARGDRVQFAERGRDSLRGLELGLRGLPPDARARASVHSGDVGASAGLAEALHDCRSVVVDPPRRGIDPHLLGRLANDPPERLAYVSCGLPAFLLQARSLLRGRRLRLGELQVMALFPHTDHVETLALFERV